MAFLRKKKIKFNVELTIQKLTDVPLLNAVIFAKVRLLDGGSFVGTTLHRPVCAHQVDFVTPSPSHQLMQPEHHQCAHHFGPNLDDDPYLMQQMNPNNHRHSITGTGLIDGIASSNISDIENHSSSQLERRHSFSEKSQNDLNLKSENSSLNRIEFQEIETQSSHYIDEDGNIVSVERNPQPFEFICYIPYDSKYTGELDACRCKISLRKEDRAGRSPQKLGYVIINLSEFAGSGSGGVTKSYLLDSYGSSQRSDNSRVYVYIRMQHNSADPLFKVPHSSTFNYQNGSDENMQHQEQYLGLWLNPADRKAPPPSPVQSANSTTVPTTSTGTSAAASTIDSFSAMQQNHPSTSMSLIMPNPLSSNLALPAASTGFGHNMPTRVQQTRRDAGDVVDEVLAENSASISESSRKASVAAASTSSSGEYESS